MQVHIPHVDWHRVFEDSPSSYSYSIISKGYDRYYLGNGLEVFMVDNPAHAHDAMMRLRASMRVGARVWMCVQACVGVCRHSCVYECTRACVLYVFMRVMYTFLHVMCACVLTIISVHAGVHACICMGAYCLYRAHSNE